MRLVLSVDVVIRQAGWPVHLSTLIPEKKSRGSYKEKTERDLVWTLRDNRLWAPRGRLGEIMAIFLAVASAGPVPNAYGIDGLGLGGSPYYYPGAYLGANYPGQPEQQFVRLPGDFVVEQQPISKYVAPAAINAADRFGNPQGIQLVLSVPSAVPPGTSVSVTVNVNSEPNGATVVSVSNPVVSAPAPTAPQQESIIVDANSNKEPATAGQLPDEFDQREPPMMFLPPFENSKDSPVLIAMQGEAQQQQLAALLKTKTF
ncbi:hypothetical protein DAPPUDRAFT_227638 [Daphnia pulex]|uniref:Uncharacterized protein n=1 Tax=Daphnia pulex TaxID=6669 RepID=E9H7W6_DAPPU|nr:hypothetical protein DAPPUDRAFT_227638 [Daphnia pulex]|eukprot:EFX72173.1 hypothetical protein DAPPUDRAFT_227638 [Daphnia pulex]